MISAECNDIVLVCMIQLYDVSRLLEAIVGIEIPDPVMNGKRSIEAWRPTAWRPAAFRSGRNEFRPALEDHVARGRRDQASAVAAVIDTVPSLEANFESKDYSCVWST